MKRFLVFSFLCIVLFTQSGFSQAGIGNVLATNNAHQIYTVWVSSDNVEQGVTIMSFFPNKLSIHVGDSVVWKINSHEIHTVTFLAGQPVPDFLIPAPSGQPSPLQINPLAAFPAAPANGLYDGTTYVNSGIMSQDPGNVKSFKLTFTKTGTFMYVCLVHGMMMSAEVDVVDNSIKTLSPSNVASIAEKQLRSAWAGVPAVMAKAHKQVVPPTHNPDGTNTYHVVVGYSSGVVDVMQFFPSQVNAHPGDTVVWTLSAADMAPHTISFLNGHPEPGLTLVVQPPTPPLVLLNPALLFPSANVISGALLNKTDFFNSGLLSPGTPATSFSIKIGNFTGSLPYLCMLHDTSGMKGRLVVSHK
ncbi:MAG: plastocyanin/azurin family copper-binding protein [Anaerolineaceae bacterium]|nr:plastocyanin/azurin family copper-binding protein [Anaerolineaceae bacterium]